MSRHKSTTVRIKDVRKTYPVSLTQALSHNGVWRSELHEEFIRQCPPDYRNGRVRRYHSMPVFDWRKEAVLMGNHPGRLEVVEYSPFKQGMTEKLKDVLMRGTLEEIQTALKAFVQSYFINGHAYNNWRDFFKTEESK